MAGMDKLTSILAVVSDAAHSAAVLDKAIFLARCFDARVELLETDRADTVLERLAGKAVDLVIKPPASEHPLRRWTFEANDRRLVQLSPVPVLLVRSRPWTRPPRFAAAVDVADRESEALARGILQAAGFLSLGAAGYLDVLYAERERHDERLRMERAVKLASLVREFRVGGESLRMVEGPPEKKLPSMLAQQHYDVLVLGAVTRRTGLSALQPLNAALAEATGGDLLLVKATEPVAAREQRRPASQGEQASHQREQLA
jgi:hypothetical protein